jgi:hypothetical protein
MRSSGALLWVLLTGAGGRWSPAKVPTGRPSGVADRLTPVGHPHCFHDPPSLRNPSVPGRGTKFANSRPKFTILTIYKVSILSSNSRSWTPHAPGFADRSR